MNRLSGRILFFTLFFCCFSKLSSQKITDKEFARAVQEADIAFYYDEDYERAAALYENLLSSKPGNPNLSAKLGICCLSIDGRNEEALKLLQTASTNVIKNDKEYIEFGNEAPLDTYLYLAIAYHANDSLEKAISLFIVAKKKLSGEDIFREDYINNQIRDCRYAIEMKKKPLNILSELFAPWLSDFKGACNPVLSKNDSIFIFTQKREGKTRILCSYKNKIWKYPVDITKQLGGYTRLYSNSITADGKILVIYMDDGGDGNLYFCTRKDSTWTKIKSAGKAINSIYWESHGFITPDGNKLYFSSNRAGGIGELDIWSSTKKPDGTWEKPENCGDIINTPFNEDTPFFDPANNALLFSSAGHISMGGYDVFRSIYRNGGWTNPVGMPFAYNTTGQNTFFILNNNLPGFIASRYDEKTSTRNIYSLVAIDPADEITATEGVITLNDGLEIDQKKASIRLINLKKGSQPRSIQVNEDGTFKFDIVPGDYQILVSHTGYKTDTINLNLPLYFLSHYMSLNPVLIPEKVIAGDFLSIKNILFDFDSYQLDEKAIAELSAIKSILTNYPELRIEVAGYTDAKGSIDYNLKLADKRAQAVIDYLKSVAIQASRFVKKSFGESNFAAVNTNRDGSDNPEGRKYNRRVAFGIVDPKTGVIIRQETFTPEHLRLVSAMKYSIILMKSTEKVAADIFDNIKLNGMLFVRTIESDSVLTYALGVFYNKTDAIKYLSYVKENGFNNAYIVNQYDLNSETRVTRRLAPIVSQSAGKKIYTIQLKAAITPVNMSLFKNYPDVREIFCEDGFYRYVTGEYAQFLKAHEVLDTFKEAGFSDAFIRELNLLIIK
jgi:outer membrane protein OmpA-like peptidoglycan-associated protein/tetratricopeptide (TPR) repeat protein